MALALLSTSSHSALRLAASCNSSLSRVSNAFLSLSANKAVSDIGFDDDEDDLMDDLAFLAVAVADGRNIYVMSMNARRDEDMVKVRETGGSRSSGGRGCEESSHLTVNIRIVMAAQATDRNIPHASRSRCESNDDPACCPDFSRLVFTVFVDLGTGKRVFTT